MSLVLLLEAAAGQQEAQNTGIDWGLVAAIAALLVAIPAAIWAMIQVGTWARERWRAYRDRKSLRHLVGAELYTKEDIELATAYYVDPDCQSIDPSGQEDFRRTVPTRAPLFEAIDRLLREPSDYKFVILLADSGMGKTTFFLNWEYG